jgi:hypothetical protein
MAIMGRAASPLLGVDVRRERPELRHRQVVEDAHPQIERDAQVGHALHQESRLQQPEEDQVGGEEEVRHLVTVRRFSRLESRA